MIIGTILTVLGGFGWVFSGVYIFNDINSNRYTYSSPLTDHEMMMLSFFVICLIIDLVGVLMIVFSIAKKKNEDKLQKIQNMQINGGKVGVCPNCGLNVTIDTDVCPRCGVKVAERK